MRPTVGEALAGMRRIMQEVVLPEVGSEYARVPAGTIITALVGLEARVDGLYPALIEENEDLRAVLEFGRRAAEHAQGIRGSAELDAAADEIDAALSADPTAGVRYPLLSVLYEANQRLNAALVELIKALDAARDTHPDDAGLHEAHRRVRLHLRASLDRDVALRGAATAR